MKIARVKATPLNVPVRVRLLGLDKATSLSVCLVEVETDTGLVGHGMTAEWTSPDDLGKQIASEVRKRASLARDAGLKPE
jgi:ribonuclease HI